MKKKKGAEWIIAHDGTKGPEAYMLECLRCGAKQPFVIPIAADVWVAAAKAFEKKHEHCTMKTLTLQIQGDFIGDEKYVKDLAGRLGE